MRRDARRQSEARAHRRATIAPLSVGALLLAGVLVLYLAGTPAPETDERLCPKDTGPVGTTVLLLDTSDPLTPKHRAELERLAGQVITDIAPGELLVVYELTEDSGSPNQLIEVCRPFKSMKDRTWLDDIHEGRRFAEKDWKRFEGALEQAFPQLETELQLTSSLLETITVIAARHMPGKRGDNQFKTHLIIFSDLLQHSPRISHYRSYPDIKVMRKNYPDLLTDLTGSEVSLYRLERPKYARWQNRHHYYWWSELIMEQGGKIKWQDSF